jgi:hypothetical protein
MNVKFRVSGIEKVSAYIKSLPRGVKIVAMRALAEYLLGNQNRGLRHEPPYKIVSRQSAYGQTFFTEKQRRWFFANLAEGNIHPWQDNRTHDIANGWTVKETDSSWTHVTISNDAPGAEWVVGLKQARQPAKVGWRTWSKTVADNLAGALRSAGAAVNDYLKSKR